MQVLMDARRKLRDFGIVCLIALQVVVPCLVVAQTTSVSNPVGFISSVRGDLFILDADGNKVAVKPGDTFGPTTTFVTGPESSGVILFADGQTVTLGHDSMLRLSDYKFDAADLKSSKATLQLMSGTMSYVSGAILADNAAGLKISGGNAAVNFLSRDVTAFVMEVDPKSIGIGTVAVTVGEIGVETPAGAIQKLGAEQFSRWEAPLGPTNPAPILAAPAVIQAAVTASRATVTGSHSPIDVRDASVIAAMAGLPATGAGNNDLGQQNQQNQQNLASPTLSTILAGITQSTTPGGGRGCTGSPC